MSLSDKDTQEIIALKNTRKYIRQRVSRKCNLIVSTINEINLEDCKQKLEDIKQLGTKLSVVDQEIGVLIQSIYSDENLEAEMSSIDDYEN